MATMVNEKKLKGVVVSSGITIPVNMIFNNGRIILESTDGRALTRDTVSTGSTQFLSSRKCAGCGIEFVPSRKDQIYHSDSCASLVRVREYRKRKKELAENKS